ncbi:MAG: trypsin-like peptidase domain-containing protein [Gemmatimonadota bacterium]|nr:MAG: trypsin-like peptidase domain-containing protein [Gemmatimonadota bacterium]
MNYKKYLLTFLFVLTSGFACSHSQQSNENERWTEKPQNEWPQITMINQITYADTSYPIAGCSFLLDTGEDTLAATAKHILIYFKSKDMNSVSFGSTLKRWKMFPKNNPADSVIVDALINENPEEPIDHIPPSKDWLLFTIKEKLSNIQPLTFRTEPFKKGERVYIVGWRYSDKVCPQVVYEGNFVESRKGSIIISTKELADNTMPGLSGSPVIDSKGHLIGLMSRKAGKMEELSPIDYPKEVIENIFK